MTWLHWLQSSKLSLPLPGQMGTCRPMTKVTKQIGALGPGINTIKKCELMVHYCTLRIALIEVPLTLQLEQVSKKTLNSSADHSLTGLVHWLHLTSITPGASLPTRLKVQFNIMCQNTHLLITGGVNLQTFLTSVAPDSLWQVDRKIATATVLRASALRITARK